MLKKINNLNFRNICTNIGRNISIVLLIMGVNDMQKSGQSQRIEIFDGMRGLASVIVMIFHMAVWTVYGYSANEYKVFANSFWRVATQTP